MYVPLSFLWIAHMCLITFLMYVLALWAPAHTKPVFPPKGGPLLSELIFFDMVLDASANPSSLYTPPLFLSPLSLPLSLPPSLPPFLHQLHMLGDGSVRGATLETCLTKILCLSSESSLLMCRQHSTYFYSMSLLYNVCTGVTFQPQPQMVNHM